MTLEYLNLIFTGIFTLEVFIKIIGLGFIGFTEDRFNIFDVVVVTISLVDIVLTYS